MPAGPPPDAAPPDAAPPYIALPPLARTLSPRTGWGRAHWECCADHLLEAAARYATPDFAQLRLPGRGSWAGVVSDGLEGFARTFLLAAFRIAGSGGAPETGRLLDRYRSGLLAGTSPAGPAAWPAIVSHSQQMVEAAAIAIALHETRPWLWDRLEPGEQDQVRAWLGGMTGKRIWQNNWLLFQAVTGQFLASAGGTPDPAEIERCLDTVEAWYLGEGWYTDGPGRNFDYYIGWAMHLYTLWWSRIAGAGDGGRGEVYRGRLREFLGQYQHFLGADGGPVHQGRSLTYRFACVAPLWLGQIFDATPLSPGQTRRLASGVLRHFAERGVPDQRGLLSLGWYERFLPITQPYSGPGSPYWASKAFAGLLLPPGHPAWTDTEEAVPADTADTVTVMPVPGFLLHSTVSDGVVRLLNHGSDHNPPPGSPAADDPHYAKVAYSSRTAPNAADPAWRRGIDNHVALVRDGRASRRTRITPAGAQDRFAASVSPAVIDGEPVGTIVTASAVHGPWEIRVHLVSADPGGMVREGGYAVADGLPPRVRAGGDDVPWALAENADGLVSAAIGLHGWAGAALAAETDANAFGPCSVTPVLMSPLRAAADTLHVSLIVLSGDAVHAEAIAASVTARITGHQAAVRFPCGELIRLTLDLDRPGSGTPGQPGTQGQPGGPCPAARIRYTREPAGGPEITFLTMSGPSPAPPAAQ